jgi:hypothetical protein
MEEDAAFQFRHDGQDLFLCCGARTRRWPFRNELLVDLLDSLEKPVYGNG